MTNNEKFMFYYKSEMNEEELKYKQFLETIFKSNFDFKIFIRDDTLCKDNCPCYAFSVIFFPCNKGINIKDMVYKDRLHSGFFESCMYHEYAHHLACKYFNQAGHTDTHMVIELFLHAKSYKLYPDIKLFYKNPIRQLSFFSVNIVKKVHKIFGSQFDDIYNEVLNERRKREA